MTTAQLKIRAFDSAYQVPVALMTEAITALRETGSYVATAPTYHRAPSAEYVAEKLAGELSDICGMEVNVNGKTLTRR